MSNVLNSSFARKGMVSNEPKYVDKQSFEMQMFMAENPDLQGASFDQATRGRDSRREIGTKNMIYGGP